MTFPLMSAMSSVSHRKVSLHRHDSSRLNFDLKTAIDDGDDDDDTDDDVVVVGIVLVIAVADEFNDLSSLPANGSVGVRVIE